MSSVLKNAFYTFLTFMNKSIRYAIDFNINREAILNIEMYLMYRILYVIGKKLWIRFRVKRHRSILKTTNSILVH